MLTARSFREFWQTRPSLNRATMGLNGVADAGIVRSPAQLRQYAGVKQDSYRITRRMGETNGM